MKLRLAAIGLVLALLSVFLVPAGTTHAARPTTGNAVTGSGLPAAFNYAGGTGTINNITFTGVQLVNGVLTATGTATGTYTPTGGSATPFTTDFTSALTPAAGVCQILDLTVGAINLNLLGLVVTTNQIHLNITAVSGPGNLLGNLLCGVAHLLDSPGSGAGLNALLGHVAALLNQLLGGLTL